MKIKTLLLIVCAAALILASCSAPRKPQHLLSKGGKSLYVLVRSEKAGEPEKFAAKELAHFLKRVTGADFKVVTENKVGSEDNAIYVGWTDFAISKGIDHTKLGEEEWIIRSAGKDIILTGGRPRGTMYAVYEFLEKELGCYWLSKDTEVIPAQPDRALSYLNKKGKPHFWTRQIHKPTGCKDDQWNFLIRNKNYRYTFRGRRDFYPKGAFSWIYGNPRQFCTFHKFINTKKYFKTHPEYFSLGQDGKRIPADGPRGPGQLCLTNSDVRRIFITELRQYIKNDRIEADKKGEPYPIIYSINQNMRTNHCLCKSCSAISDKNKSEAELYSRKYRKRLSGDFDRNPCCKCHYCSSAEDKAQEKCNYCLVRCLQLVRCNQAFKSPLE
jgi:hypothetical protein